MNIIGYIFEWLFFEIIEKIIYVVYLLFKGKSEADARRKSNAQKRHEKERDQKLDRMLEKEDKN